MLRTHLSNPIASSLDRLVDISAYATGCWTGPPWTLSTGSSTGGAHSRVVSSVGRRRLRIDDVDDPAQVVQRRELDADLAAALPQVDLHPGLEALREAVRQLGQTRGHRAAAYLAAGVAAAHLADSNDLLEPSHTDALGHDALSLEPASWSSALATPSKARA